MNKFITFLCLNALLIGCASLAMDSDMDSDKGGELHDAARSGNLELVQALLTAGAPVDAKKSWSLMTPLMWAARGGRMDLCQLLIAANAQVDAKFSGGWTVLNIAAAYNREPICHLLINRTLDQCILPGAMITLLGIKKFHKSPLLGQIDRHIINNIIRQACAHAPKIKALFTQIEAIENKDMKNNLRECAQQQLKLKMDQKTNNGDSHE